MPMYFSLACPVKVPKSMQRVIPPPLCPLSFPCTAYILFCQGSRHEALQLSISIIYLQELTRTSCGYL